jgi:tetratricopeptide (TPR) repeat protein
MKKVHNTTMKLLILIAWVAYSGLVVAQSKKLDSLRSELESNPDNAEVLWGIAYELFDVDNVEALRYAERAYEKVWTIDDSLVIVKVGTTYGQLLRRMDRVDESIEISSRLLPISRRHDFRKYTKMLLNSLALAYTFNNQFDRALEYNLESLDVRKKEGNQEEIAIALQNIGLLYFKLGDPHLGLQYSIETQEIIKRAKISYHGADILLTTMGYCFTDLHQFETAMEHFKKALQNSTLRNDLISMTSSELGIGRLLVKMMKCEEAKAHLLRSLRFAVDSKNAIYQISTLVLLSESSLCQGNYLESKVYLDSIKRVPALMNNAWLMMDYIDQRAKLSLALNQFKLASLYLKQYVTLKDSILNSRTINELRRIHLAYLQKESKERIESQGRILMLQGEVLARQKWVIFLCIAIVLLVGILAIVLFRANKRKARINYILDCRVKERTLELGHQRDALQHIVDEQRILRRRMSEEIVALTASLKGIIHLGGIEEPANYSNIFKLAESQADNILRVITRFKSNEKSRT